MGRRRNENKEPLLRGKYLAWRYPMLAERPDIDPGQFWDGEPPAGFRLDKNGRIWPVALRRGREIPDEKRCTATGRDGERCGAYRMKRREVCRMHGGEERAGAEHPHTKTGEHFRHGIFGDVLSPDLFEWYERALGDPQLYDLTHEIAVLTHLEREAVASLSNGEGKADWKSAGDAMDKFYAAWQAGDKDAMAEHLNALRTTIRRGRAQASARRELGELVERKRRLTETERKRRLDLRLVVSAEQLRGLLRAFTVIVFSELQNLPQLVALLIKKEKKLDTGRLAQALTARIGERMTIVCQGMKAGQLAEADSAPGSVPALPSSRGS